MKEILCDNCEAVPATDHVQDGLSEGLHLCAACKDTFDEHTCGSVGDSCMMMTREFVQEINPIFNRPGKLLIRSVALLRAMWPEVPIENWRLVAGYHIEGTVAVLIDPLVSVRLVISTDATSAMIAIENPLPGMPIIGSIKRMALRNTDWLDILGWVNSAKTWYDRRDEEKLKQCLKEGLVREEEYLLSDPLTPPEALYMADENSGWVAKGSHHSLYYEDDKGKKLSPDEVEHLLETNVAALHIPERAQSPVFEDVEMKPTTITPTKKENL